MRGYLSRDLTFNHMSKMKLFLYLPHYPQPQKHGSPPGFSFSVTNTTIIPVLQPRNLGVILDYLFKLTVPCLITIKFCQFISQISLKSPHFISTTTTVSLIEPPFFPARTYNNYLLTGPPPSTLTTSPKYTLCCRRSDFFII